MSDNKFFRYAVGAIVVFLLGVVLKSARSIVYPFILAVFIASVIDPVVALVTRLKIPKAAAVALILIGAFVVLFLFGLVVYSSGKTLAAGLPRYQKRAVEMARFAERGLGGLPVSPQVASSVEKINLHGLAALLLGALGPFLGLVSKLVLLFLFLVIIVSGRGSLAEKIRLTLKPELAVETIGALERISSQARRYLIAKTLLSLAKGLAVWAVLDLFGVDFAVVFGFLAFLMNYIPNIGSVTTAALCSAFAFFEVGSPWSSLWIFVIAIGLDVALANLVEPRIIERGWGLSPFMVLLSLLFWGWLWGIPGVVMAVPLTIVLKITCQNVPVLQPIANLMNP